jgi:hypothetical protein
MVARLRGGDVPSPPILLRLDLPRPNALIKRRAAHAEDSCSLDDLEAKLRQLADRLITKPLTACARSAVRSSDMPSPLAPQSAT